MASVVYNSFVISAVAEKRRAFEEWLQRRDSFTYDRYRVQRLAVKLAVQAAKKNGGPAMGIAIGERFRW